MVKNSDSNYHQIKMFVLLVFLLIVPQVCLANPVSIPCWTPDRSYLLFALGVDFFVDLIVVIITLALMKELYVVGGLNFTFFMIFMVAGGFVIDALSIFLANVFGLVWSALAGTEGRFAFTLALVTFLFLFVYNYLLSGRFLGLSKRQRIVLATVIGIATNPVYYFMMSNVPSL